MRLYYSPASPYARKVLVVADELGLASQIETVVIAANPVGGPGELAAVNPLAKIPTLRLADGEALYDSRVIVDHLITLSKVAILPEAWRERRAIMVEQATADGLLDAALLARYELALRPESLRWPEWIAGQMAKIDRALDRFEPVRREVEPTLGDIAVACALGYLDFRFADYDWRSSRPSLRAFYEIFSERPSMTATDPRLT